MFRPLLLRISCARSAVVKILARETATVTTPNTVAWEKSAGSRFGTVVRVGRIMPVPYSPVMTIASRTVTTNELNAMVADCTQ